MTLSAHRKNIWSPWPIFLIHVLGVLSALGCGKPATADECQRIVERITELELKEARIADDEVVKAQVAQTQVAFKERMLSDCVGQRISSGAIACVEQATTAREIVEVCFD